MIDAKPIFLISGTASGVVAPPQATVVSSLAKFCTPGTVCLVTCCADAGRDPKAAAHLAEWLRKLRHDHGDRILPVTDQIAVEWGRIAAIRPRGDIDGLIAATAIVHDLILVTRNVKDFEDTDASVINPWETPG